MRFAVKTRPEHTTWQQMRDVWVAADQLEIFESAWHWDHFYPLSGDMAGPNLEAWTTLAALAQATSRIRVGCQVTGMIYRHPAVLANMAATTDIISGGRLELGVGAGWNEMETAAYGIELYPLKERFDRFDEGVQAIIALLTEKSANFDGKYVKLTDAYCRPRIRRSPSAARVRSARCGRSPSGPSTGTSSSRVRRSGSRSRTSSCSTARTSAGMSPRSRAR